AIGTPGKRTQVGSAVCRARRKGELTMCVGSPAQPAATCRAWAVPSGVSGMATRSRVGWPALPVLWPWRTKVTRIETLRPDYMAIRRPAPMLLQTRLPHAKAPAELALPGRWVRPLRAAE